MWLNVFNEDYLDICFIWRYYKVGNKHLNLWQNQYIRQNIK